MEVRAVQDVKHLRAELELLRFSHLEIPKGAEVDAILSGTHERGTSHYELLRAFVDDETLDRIDQELNAHDYRTHEFGDSVFLERAANRAAHSAQPSVAA